MVNKDVKAVQGAKEVKEKSGDAAAFFDLDGTLLPLPSLEKRFFSMLRYRKLIGLRNYILWIAETVRLVPRGMNHVIEANKMYLRGVRMDVQAGAEGISVCHLGKDAAEENALKHGARGGEARTPAPPFYPEAIERVVWHAERGHLIVIVSGTLEPLAERAARMLEAELGGRALACTIRVCATRLEQISERWTGRIVGEAMFGQAKARAIRLVAADEGLDLRRGFAYGDSTSDKWMLEAVGKPAAVNPSNDLARIARRNDWPILRWGKEKASTEKAQKSQRTGETDSEWQAARAKAGFRA